MLTFPGTKTRWSVVIQTRVAFAFLSTMAGILKTFCEILTIIIFVGEPYQQSDQGPMLYKFLQP